MTARLGILCSGSGSTYANLVAHIEAGTVPASVATVVVSREQAGARARATAWSHPCTVACESEAIAAALRQHDCQWVAMCGFMRRFDVPADFAGRVINVHPSLLPAFGGKGFWGDHVHRAVLAAGVRVSGCSVHLVAGDYDSGPLLAQRPVAVWPGDSVDMLRERVQAAERHLYPLVLRSLIEHGVQRDSEGRPWLQSVSGCDDWDLGFARLGQP